MGVESGIQKLMLTSNEKVANLSTPIFFSFKQNFTKSQLTNFKLVMNKPISPIIRKEEIFEYDWAAFAIKNFVPQKKGKFKSKITSSSDLMLYSEKKTPRIFAAS